MFSVILAGGGTGGHIYPAVAVAKELQRVRSDAKVDFIGREGGIEATIYRQEGFPARFLDITPPPREMGWELMLSL